MKPQRSNSKKSSLKLDLLSAFGEFGLHEHYMNHVGPFH